MSSAIYQAYVDELEKISGKKKRKGPPKRSLLAGALGGVALGGAAWVAARRGARSQFRAWVQGLGKGGAKAVEVRKSVPRVVQQQADKVRDHLLRSGVDPNKAVIAVSGLGGSGKSTFSRALSKSLKMPHHDLDMAVKREGLRGRDIFSHMQKSPPKPGSIVEQSHVLSRGDPSRYDVAIKFDTPLKTVKNRLAKRGRGAFQLDVYNYSRLNRLLDTAYDVLPGKARNIGTAKVKIAPPTGFSDDILKQRLSRRSILHSTPRSGKDREDMLVSLARGKRVGKGNGQWWYVKTGPGLQLPMFMAGAGAAGVAGQHYMRRRKPLNA